MSEDQPTRALRAHGASFLNSQQAAFYLGVSLRHLERLRSRGVGPPCRYHSPRNVRYTVEELLAWSESQRRSQHHG